MKKLLTGPWRLTRDLGAEAARFLIGSRVRAEASAAKQDREQEARRRRRSMQLVASEDDLEKKKAKP